ncbi:MAG: TMEM175 family protein [Sphingomonas sp.]|uniref:TMEM175 family protein n=1 Tax=Sphingomonas sp. TaxID=28214 RepID=UPI003F7F0D79
MSEEATEGKPGVGRIEAFSDGVLAIIVTIMVLELHAPEAPGLDKLLPLWPVFLAYALSFAYVGIYWANHHRLFSHAKMVTNALVWLNLGLLFALSLIPFTTAYLGEQHFSRDGTLVYLASMIFPGIFYVPLQHVIRVTGVQGPRAETYHRRTTRKGVAAVLIYVTGGALTFVSPWLGIAAAAIVAILWCMPKSPLDALFGE